MLPLVITVHDKGEGGDISHSDTSHSGLTHITCYIPSRNAPGIHLPALQCAVHFQATIGGTISSFLYQVGLFLPDMRAF